MSCPMCGYAMYQTILANWHCQMCHTTFTRGEILMIRKLIQERTRRAAKRKLVIVPAPFYKALEGSDLTP